MNNTTDNPSQHSREADFIVSVVFVTGLLGLLIFVSKMTCQLPKQEPKPKFKPQPNSNILPTQIRLHKPKYATDIETNSINISEHSLTLSDEYTSLESTPEYKPRKLKTSPYPSPESIPRKLNMSQTELPKLPSFVVVKNYPPPHIPTVPTNPIII